MKLRHLTQSALRKTASAMLTVEHKLEPTPQDEIITLLKKADIPTPVLINTLDYLQSQLAEMEADNA